MLAARERVGLDPDEPQQARHGALDLVAERLGLGLPGELRGAERPDDVERHARGRAGRVDRDVRRVPQAPAAAPGRCPALEALRARSSPASPRTRPGDPCGAARPTRHPGAEAGGGEVGEDEREVPMSPFGSRISTGIPASSASSMRTIASPVLPEPVMPDDDAVRRQVARADDDPVGARLARRGVDRRCRGGTNRGRPCAPESRVNGPLLAELRVEPGCARAAGGARPRRHARRREARRGGAPRGFRERIDDAAVPAPRRGHAQRPPRPAGSRRVGEGRRHPSCLRRRQPDRGRGHLVPRAGSGRARARLPVARPRGAPAARRGRHLQPLALRGRRRRAHARACAGERSGVAATGTSATSSGRSSTRERRSSRCSSTCRARMQRARLQERIDDPEKRWKFRHDDLDVLRALRRVPRGLGRRPDARPPPTGRPGTSCRPIATGSRRWPSPSCSSRALEALDPQLPEPEEGIEGLRVE